MVEEAFVNSEIRQPELSICGNCYKASANFIACPNCTSALFCCEACAEDSLHKIRCFRSSTDDDKSIEFALRSIVRAIDIFPNVQNLMKFVKIAFIEKNQNEKQIPQSMADMKSQYRLYRSWEMFENLLMKPEYEILFRTEYEKRFLMHLCLMHHHIVHRNSFHSQISDKVFLLRNHLNHSCAPNLLGVYHENKSVSITSRRIKKGDQLFISYEPECWTHPRDVRQKILAREFDFQCKCEKCENSKWPISSEGVYYDPEFQYLLDEFYVKEYKFDDGAKSVFLKQKCIDLLIKYSDLPWCMELDKVSEWFEGTANTLTFGYFVYSFTDRIRLFSNGVSNGSEEI